MLCPYAGNGSIHLLSVFSQCISKIILSSLFSKLYCTTGCDFPDTGSRIKNTTSKCRTLMCLVINPGHFFNSAVCLISRITNKVTIIRATEILLEVVLRHFLRTGILFVIQLVVRICPYRPHILISKCINSSPRLSTLSDCFIRNKAHFPCLCRSKHGCCLRFQRISSDGLLQCADFRSRLLCRLVPCHRSALRHSRFKLLDGRIVIKYDPIRNSAGISGSTGRKGTRRLRSIICRMLSVSRLFRPFFGLPDIVLRFGVLSLCTGFFLRKILHLPLSLLDILCRFNDCGVPLLRHLRRTTHSISFLRFDLCFVQFLPEIVFGNSLLLLCRLQCLISFTQRTVRLLDFLLSFLLSFSHCLRCLRGSLRRDRHCHIVKGRNLFLCGSSPRIGPSRT